MIIREMVRTISKVMTCALSLSILMWVTAASADQCTATVPPKSGWIMTGGGNIDVTSNRGETWQEVVSRVASSTKRYNLASGWHNYTISVLSIDQENPEIVWVDYDWSGQLYEGEEPPRGPECCGPAWVTIQPEYICDSGYTLNYSSGSPQCLLTNLNLRECSTDVKPDLERGCDKASVMEGNPCNVDTGNKFQMEMDFVQADGSKLAYSRYYNSDATTPVGSHANRWRGSFDRHIVFSENDGWIASEYIGPPQAFVRRETGRVIPYLLGTQITPKYPATVETLRQIDDRTHEFVDDEGTIETYKLGNVSGICFSCARLVSIRYGNGSTLTLEYVSDRLSVVRDEFGHKLTFTYNSSNRMTKFTDPNNKAHTYTYNSSGYLTKITYPDTTFRQYTYGAGASAGLLTNIIDESGVTYASWTYDASKRVTSSQHAGGAGSVTLAYNVDGTRTVTDALGSVRTFEFDLIQNSLKPASRTEGGNSTEVSYDANGFPSSRVDRNGVETLYVHDSQGRETSKTVAAGTLNAKTTTTQWHATLRVPTLITEAHRTTAYTYNALGNVLTRTITDTVTAQSRTWTYTYDTYGRLLTVNGPRSDVSDVTTYAYYTCTTGGRCGRLQTATNAAGHVTTYNTYDAHGRPLTVTDPNGVITTRVYDLKGRITSKTVGSGATTFEYWPTSLLKKITWPDASYLLYTYDAAHRLAEIKDGENHRIAYTLDAMGNRTAEQVFDEFSSVTSSRTRAFTTLNKLWKEIGSDGTTNVTTVFNYDDNGNLTGVNAPMGRDSTSAYDELNRLTEVIDAQSGVTGYGYNALDQTISVTDPRSLSTLYTHNALGDLLEINSPDSGTTTSTFDQNGNLQTQTDGRGKTGTFSYDALNRVTGIAYPDQTIAVTYDTGTNQKGRLKQITDASGSTVWNYDTRGRVLSRQQSMGTTKIVSYTYDTRSRVTSMTLPSGSVIGYTYTQGRLSGITLNGSTTLLSGALYQPFGPTRGWSWGAGGLSIREYDLDEQVTNIDSAGLKSYSYDDAFRITGVDDASNAALNQDYGYDQLDRLTSATTTAVNQSWTYDSNGNRLSQGGSQASTYTVAGGSNRLSEITGALSRVYTYDASGNVTGDGTSTFAYNDAGRMTSSTTAGVTTTYAHNGLGQRVRKTTAGSSIYYLYGEAGHLIGEYSNAGNLLQEIVWFNDIPVALLRSNGSGGVNVFYVHADHLNTPRRITRAADGVVVWRWDSDPFGTTLGNEDPDGDSNLFVFNLRFPGQYRDAESGLLYNYHRSYDSLTGRYTQSDPLGLRAGLNTYAYVRANPLSRFDSFGLQEDEPPPVLEDETGAGKDAQAACDAELDRAAAERAAAEARANGDWEKYYDEMGKAYRALDRYYRNLGQPVPNDPTPRGPTPPRPSPPNPTTLSEPTPSTPAPNVPPPPKL